MNATRRPASVWVLSWLYIAVGTVAFVYYLPALAADQAEGVLIEVTEILAILSGIFMFLGRNWARWLALAWMAFHVVISFPVVRQVVNHSIILGLIAWLLFRQDARRYFQPLNGNSE